MRFLKRCIYAYIYLLCLFSGSSFAGVQVDWELINNGKTLRGKVLSATADYEQQANFILDCGVFSKCTAYINLALKISEIPSSRGRQKVSKLLVNWVATSPIVVINDWDKLTEKNGGRPICLNFNISGSISGDSGTIGGTCEGTATPPPTVDPPKPPVSCNINGNIYLQHGTLTSTEAQSHRTYTNARISCTRAAKVKVRALSGVGGSAIIKLRADSSLQSILYVNDSGGNEGVTLDVPSTGKDVTFSSMLVVGNGVTEGTFSGSAVAIIDIL